MRILLLVAAVGLAGCGLAPSAACDFRKSSGSARCQERLNSISSAAFKATCSAAQGVASDGACPRDGVVGGCDLGQQGDGSQINDWYYAPKTLADAKSDCAGDKGTFLTP